MLYATSSISKMEYIFGVKQQLSQSVIDLFMPKDSCRLTAFCYSSFIFDSKSICGSVSHFDHQHEIIDVCTSDKVICKEIKCFSGHIFCHVQHEYKHLLTRFLNNIVVILSGLPIVNNYPRIPIENTSSALCTILHLFQNLFCGRLN